jgi:hypothetical protein
MGKPTTKEGSRINLWASAVTITANDASINIAFFIIYLNMLQNYKNIRTKEEIAEF